MPEQVLKNVGIWIDGRNMAGVSNSVGLTPKADAPQSTSFEGGWRTRAEGGLKTVALSLEGWYDRGDIDAAQFESIGNDGSIMIAPAGQSAGRVAFIVPYIAAAFEPGASVGELMAFTFASEGDSAPVRAEVFAINDSVTADTETSRLDLGAVSATQTLRVWIHATRVSATGTMDVTLVSHTARTGGTSTDRGTADIADTGVYVIEADGAITDEFWSIEYEPTSAEYDIAAASQFAAK